MKPDKTKEEINYLYYVFFFFFRFSFFLHVSITNQILQLCMARTAWSESLSRFALDRFGY